MKLKEFLEKHVEGYLFGDAKSMEAVSPPPKSDYGALAYPLLMSALSGIELLGALVSTSTFDRNSGDRYFRGFWRGYLYPTDPQRKAAGDPLYQLARHGLAHVYFPKGPIVVAKGLSALHLVVENNKILYIDPCVLSKDLRAAYERSVKPLLASQGTKLPNAVSMETRLGEMLAAYDQQANRDMAPLLQLPAVPIGLPD